MTGPKLLDNVDFDVRWSPAGIQDQMGAVLLLARVGEKIFDTQRSGVPAGALDVRLVLSLIGAVAMAIASKAPIATQVSVLACNSGLGGSFLSELMEGDLMVASDFEKQVSGYGLTTARNPVPASRSSLVAAVLSLAGLRHVS